jgi:F-type H+-transporting ATPase subunit epsilon
MSDKILFELVSPEKLLLSTEADMVTIPGSEGEMGVMSGHMPLLTTLKAGVITIAGGEGDAKFRVGGGFAEATAEKLTVLADQAIAEGVLI